jgi:acetyl-CoA acetyltransferase
MAPVTIAQRKGDPVIVACRMNIRVRAPHWKVLRACLPPFRQGGSVTAGNASGVNDGAAALLIASEAGMKGAWADPACPDHGRRIGRRSTAHHGDRAGASGPNACGARLGPDAPPILV